MACSSAHRYRYGIGLESLILPAAAALQCLLPQCNLTTGKEGSNLPKAGSADRFRYTAALHLRGEGSLAGDGQAVFAACGMRPAMAGFPLAKESS